MAMLEQLHILRIVPEPPIPRAYVLNPSFANSFRSALQNESSESFGVAVTSRTGPEIELEFLDEWARKQWESILYYMVGSTGTGGLGGGSQIAGGTIHLLEWGDYVKIKGGKPRITKNGFEFLLQEPNAQVWNLLIVYLSNAESVRRENRLRLNPSDISPAKNELD